MNEMDHLTGINPRIIWIIEAIQQKPQGESKKLKVHDFW